MRHGFSKDMVRFTRLEGAEVFVGGRHGWVAANQCQVCKMYFPIGTMERHLQGTKCGRMPSVPVGVIGKVGGPRSSGDGDYDANGRAND